MSDENPSVMSHVSIGTNDFKKAIAFYDSVMATIGAKRIEEIEEVDAIAYGKIFPEFWVNTPHDDGKAEIANGTHFAFMAPNKEAVHDFWKAALEAGAKPEGEPGPRPHYGQPYYGCFMRDLDGHKIECMYWDGD
jgi:catechol 2,3-dioxygenase-like lactoylglutathione lyase family enzyme